MSLFYRVTYTLDEDFDSIENARNFRDMLPSHADVTLQIIKEDDSDV